METMKTHHDFSIHTLRLGIALWRQHYEAVREYVEHRNAKTATHLPRPAIRVNLAASPRTTEPKCEISESTNTPNLINKAAICKKDLAKPDNGTL